MEKEFNMPLEIRNTEFQSEEVKEETIKTSPDDTISKAALFSYLMS